MKKRNLLYHLIAMSICLLFLFAMPLTAMSKEKKIVWRNAIMCAGTEDAFNWVQLAKDVKKATNGRLEIELYLPGEHPYAPADSLRAVRDNEFQITGLSGGYVTGVDPRLGALDLPMLLPGGDYETFLKVHDVFDSYLKKVLDERWNAEVLIHHNWGNMQFFMKKGFLEDWDSFKGKKVRVWSAEIADLVTLLNGTPINIPWGEVYTSLATGLVNGLTTDFFSAYSTRLTELAPNLTMMSYMFGTNNYIVNKDALNALPADVKEILLNLMAEKDHEFRTATVQKDGLALQEAFLKDNIKAHGISKGFFKEVREKSYEAIWKPWIKRSGPEGAAAFDEVAKLIIDLGYDVPGYKPQN
ncbi:TRAP-type C4-dicarboxylate transport system, substrate-binding protein [Desulfocicer vacuolatum DSM 3385]|uniref:TRAP-type C4-dicarboxylate transport system, substrate-binding protein n=1 Tax=Desulfocicer vacuolatum DSM 3385 TaxID=1121400 RepID=A0A1W1YSB6_9BACT|nr:TRAP transporter substrate-binding protein DctP [Desulfocicer vacuolatum]SMC39013.1 TRAP-type C4-dicarboxylate transport system, substrate-binding protein [Desulfocicer vacuolatum DSM 3385]